MSFLGINLGKGLTSVFTPAGTNARRKQEAGQQSIANQAGTIANTAGTQYQNALNFGGGFAPGIQDGLAALYQSTSQAGLANQAIQAGKRARSQAMSQSVPGQFQGNSVLEQAYRMMNLNKAQDATNQGIFNSYDPQQRTQALMAFMQALQGYKSGAASDFSNAAGIVYGQPGVQVQSGFLDQIAPFAGLFMGSNNAGQLGQASRPISGVSNGAAASMGAAALAAANNSFGVNPNLDNFIRTSGGLGYQQGFQPNPFNFKGF